MRACTRIICAAPLLFVLLGPGRTLADSFDKHMHSASEFLSHGNFDDAIAEYQKALKRQPKSVLAQSALGMAYMQLGDLRSKNRDLAGAIDVYRKAVALGPDEPYWHERLGAALERNGDHDGALAEYRTAAGLSPLDDGLQAKYEQFAGVPENQRASCEKQYKAETTHRAGTFQGRGSPPIPLRKPDPAYSDWARQAKLQGTVVLWITIDRDGNVACMRNVRPLGLGLDAKALETVRTWKFQPATLGDEPVPVNVMVEVSFKLF
jgi:TonB family protein